ncbi:PucR family transcriptional regulator [Tamaricihabitans halophyticus]|nr:PucR family transcriptional regulator [Tamaricihabitans halophyticus]
MADNQAPGSIPRALLGSLSVQEVCEFEMFAEATVLAGVAGLGRRVQRLNVMTVPDIARWTKAHELLLTTGYPLPDSPAELIDLFTELNSRGVAAVGVKYGNYGPGLMPEVLTAADDLALPIIDIPEHVAFDDVLSLVLSDITNRQAAALAHAQEIHEALLRIVLDGGCLDDIVRELSAVLGGPGVLCVDFAGQVLASQLRDEHWAVLAEQRLVDADGALATGRLNGPSAESVAGLQAVVAAPVLAGTLRHGFLLAVAGTEPLPPEAEVMVQQSAMVAALDITKRLAVTAVERHFESSAIHDLLTGGERDVDEVLARADAFGWELDGPLFVLVARHDPNHPDGRGELRHEHEIDAWVSAVRGVDRLAAAGGLGRDLVAVCSAADGVDVVAQAVSKAVQWMTRSSFSVGVSAEVPDPRRLPVGYQQARTALDLGQQISGPGAVAAYPKLGVFRLLHAVGDPAELRTFVDEALGGVLECAEQERTSLLRTLEVLLEQNLNVAESARVLHFHYNSMRYRIRKLERLVGSFSSDSQLRLRLAIALQILRMWEQSAPSNARQ